MAATIEVKDKKLRRAMKRLAGNAKQIGNISSEYINAITPRVLRDINEHFEKAPPGKTGGSIGNTTWAAWSDAYAKNMASRGKAGNLLLQDTGHMKRSIYPGKPKKSGSGVMWFNAAPYSAQHDEGDPSKNLPARPFMWISDHAFEEVALITLNFVTKL